jgi:hypothetical protein
MINEEIETTEEIDSFPILRFFHAWARFDPQRPTLWRDETFKARIDVTTRITVAYHTTSIADKFIVTYGVAFCSPTDNFVKVEGRAIAARRALVERKTCALTCFKTEQIASKICQDIEAKFRSRSKELRGMPRTWKNVQIYLFE